MAESDEDAIVIPELLDLLKNSKVSTPVRDSSKHGHHRISSSFSKNMVKNDRLHWDMEASYQHSVVEPPSTPSKRYQDPENIVLKTPGKLSLLANDVFTTSSGQHKPVSSDGNLQSKNIIAESGDFALAHKWYSRTIFGVNIIFLVMAMVLIAAGSWSMNSLIVHLISGQTLPNGSLALGVSICYYLCSIIAGAVFQSRVTLACYAFTVFILLVCQIAIGIALYTIRDGKDIITDAWSKASNDSRVELQNLYVCCGLTVYNVDTGNPCSIDPDSFRPCINLFVSGYSKTYTTVAGVMITFFVLECITISVAIYLLRKVRELRQIRQDENTYLFPAFSK